MRRGSISLSAVFWVKATAVLNAAADQPRESGMTPGETSYGGPPTGTTLHIKRPRERRTALSNHCHRRRRRRHSFRFNFFPLAPYSSLFFFLNARDLGIRPSAFLPLSICDPPIFLPCHRFSLSPTFRFFFCSPLIRVSSFIMLVHLPFKSFPLFSFVYFVLPAEPFIRFLFVIRIIN